MVDKGDVIDIRAGTMLRLSAKEFYLYDHDYTWLPGAVTRGAVAMVVSSHTDDTLFVVCDGRVARIPISFCGGNLLWWVPV